MTVDIQLYISFKPHETDKLTVLHNCLTAIKDEGWHSVCNMVFLRSVVAHVSLFSTLCTVLWSY